MDWTTEDDIVWKPVAGYVGLYEVSNTGEVRRANGGKPVGQFLNQDGYPTVRLSGPRAVHRVHRIVASAFCPNPDDKPSVNHIDHNRANNHADNLEWCTQKENLRHARLHGRMPDNYWAGRITPTAKLTFDQAREIRARYSTGIYSQQRLGERYGVSKFSIYKIVNGLSYTEEQEKLDGMA